MAKRFETSFDYIVKVANQKETGAFSIRLERSLSLIKRIPRRLPGNRTNRVRTSPASTARIIELRLNCATLAPVEGIRRQRGSVELGRVEVETRVEFLSVSIRF